MPASNGFPGRDAPGSNGFPGGGGAPGSNGFPGGGAAPGANSTPGGGGAPSPEGAPRPCPNLGLLARHAATICGLIRGKGRLPRRRCCMPFMIGSTQSSSSPTPDLAPPRTNPARSHDAVIWAHGWAIWPGWASDGAAPGPNGFPGGGGAPGSNGGGGSPGANGAPPPCPNLGLLARHAATTCGLIRGKGRLPRRRCGMPFMIGSTQSSSSPTTGSCAAAHKSRPSA